MRKEFIKAMAKADDELMKMTLLIGLLEIKRSGDDTWTDVATLNAINAKLSEVSKMIKDYAKTRGID